MQTRSQIKSKNVSGSVTRNRVKTIEPIVHFSDNVLRPYSLRSNVSGKLHLAPAIVQQEVAMELRSNKNKKVVEDLSPNIDFDEASRLWRANKRRMGNGCYKYI